MNLSNYQDRIKALQQTVKAEDVVLGKKSASSEWTELVGELTDYLNDNRGKYGPWDPSLVAQKIAYIKTKGGMGELRYFIDMVKEKGSWMFWYTVSPKKK